MSSIGPLFGTRDFVRHAPDGTTTSVKLLISMPQRVTVPNIPAAEEWYQVVWQIQGLQPSLDPATGHPTGPSGVVTLATENFDPISTMLFALYSIRSYLEQCTEGRAGVLKWKDVPEDPTWGLPAFVPPNFSLAGGGGRARRMAG